MAFKLKSGNKPTFKNMGSSPFKATAAEMRAAGVSEGTVKLADPDAGEKAYGGDRTWKEGQKASGGTLNDLVAKRKTLEKGSREWNVNQNAINKALGSKKRHDVADKPADTSKTSKVTGRTTTTTTDDKGAVDTTVTRKDGSVKKTIDQTNRSTWDPETQTGSSGLGIQETTKKYKRSGKPKKKTKTTYSMGTDTKKDDKVVKIKIGKRKQKHKEIDPTAGTVTKTKHFTKGKRAGTSKTRVRKKGKLFGRKVDVDYS
jgi:hypothetical protein